jgi:rod shape-determining protein MreB
MAGAIGIGLPIHESVGSMVIDIGGGTTDIAVIALFGVVKSSSIKVAGDRFNEDIITYIKENFGILIGERSAEEVKIEVGSVTPTGNNVTTVRGRDLATGLPKEAQVSDLDIAKAITSSVTLIVDSTRKILRETPPEIMSDIMKTGIYITGGGAYIRGLASLISHELNITVHVAEDPMSAVAKGCGKILENIEYYKEVLIKDVTLSY